MDFDTDTWLLVLNPVSGRGAGVRDRQRIEEALAAHGLRNITLIRHMGRLEVMRSLPRLFDGTIAGHPKVAAWQTGSIELEGPAGAAMEADGELAGHLPAVVRVERNALRVVAPQQIERM